METKKNTNLIACRLSNNYTQSYMAKLLNITDRAYMYKEHGVCDFKLSEIKKLLELFDKKFEEVF